MTRYLEQRGLRWQWHLLRARTRFRLSEWWWGRKTRSTCGHRYRDHGPGDCPLCICCFDFIEDARPPYCQSCHDDGCP